MSGPLTTPRRCVNPPLRWRREFDRMRQLGTWNGTGGTKQSSSEYPWRFETTLRGAH